MSTATPATLSDVIASVISLLVAVGEADYPHVSGSGKTEILLGERYLREEGAPPRIIMVQTEDGGQLGPALAIGARQVAGITETVRCYVWGAEASDDRLRYDDAKARAMRLINAFKASAPGRLKGARLVRGKDSNIVTFGEEYQLTISYTWGVPEDAVIWAAAFAANPDPTSPPRPDQPQGDTGLEFTTGPVSTSNTRP